MNEEERERTRGVKTRNILWYLAFFGFGINYIIRINVSIAIVEMVDANMKKSSGNQTVVTSECIIARNSTQSKVMEDELQLSEDTKHVSLERRLLDFLGIDYERDGFKWDAKQQALVLGSFFWLHWVTQIPGGVLAAKYGTKLVFGLTNYLACLMCMVMPILCYLDYRLMVGLRLIQGFIVGMAWPAMHHLTAQWIPPNERSRFASSCMGSSVGVAVTYPIFGFIIRSSSWEWVFHASAIIGTVWYILWLYFVYDSPEKHPRIHPKEKEYILKELGSSVMKSHEKRTVPWMSIFTSKLVWLNALAQWGGIWGMITLLTQAPTYFRFIHGWGIEMTGVLSGFPHLLRAGFAIIFSSFADWSLSRGRISRNNVRRLATFFCLILNGFAMIGLAYSGCNNTAAIFFLSTGLCLHGAVSAATLPSMVDIAPNFAGITMGIVTTVGIATGFVSPIVVGYITYENQSIEAWQLIFKISAAMLLGCGTIYILFNDTAVQKWNKSRGTVDDDTRELKPLFNTMTVTIEPKKLLNDNEINRQQ